MAPWLHDSQAACSELLLAFERLAVRARIIVLLEIKHAPEIDSAVGICATQTACHGLEDTLQHSTACQALAQLHCLSALQKPARGVSDIILIKNAADDEAVSHAYVTSIRSQVHAFAL